MYGLGAFEDARVFPLRKHVVDLDVSSRNFNIIGRLFGCFLNIYIYIYIYIDEKEKVYQIDTLPGSLHDALVRIKRDHRRQPHALLVVLPFVFGIK